MVLAICTLIPWTGIADSIAQDSVHKELVTGAESTQVDTLSDDTKLTDATLDTPWRYTRFGWEDSRTWFRYDSKVPVLALDRIHPLLWASNILLAAIGAAIWASDEWQVARLFGRKKTEQKTND